MLFADAHFKLTTRMDNGKTYREDLEQAAVNSVSARAELDALTKAEMPEGAADIWGIYLEISAHRTSNGFGPAPLSWLDLDAWQRVVDYRLSPEERDCVFELDVHYLKQWSEAQKAKRPSK